ncbi:MAG: uracil-DNA glycosylase [candidate division NC10 bacterium]|nr:uracil-DNA glycosylase [candidate division NC10 bacterium]
MRKRSSDWRALARLQAEVVHCTRCPRLTRHREQVAAQKVRRYRDWEYWGRPIPGFGDPEAALLLVGLAPAAHGGNRTGRIFTGDRSGEWLYQALHTFGFANQPFSIARGDGLKLTDCYVTAALRCPPPQNRPTRRELENCRPYLVREVGLLPRLQVVVTLGRIAFDAFLKVCEETGIALPRPRPRFAHGARVRLGRGLTMLASYHPSQQNTLTRRLTRPMFHAIFREARRLLSKKENPV